MEEKKGNEKSIFEEAGKKVGNKNVLAALSYLWALCLIPLLGSKDEFVKFHARQGFVLFVIEVVLAILMWIPVIGWLLGLIVGIVAIIGFIKALNGEKWEIPYIYNLSKKIKI
jgi:uncharacterized membrane protein